MHPQIPSAPVLLGGTITLTAARPQGSVDEFVNTLNPFRTPLLVDEISLYAASLFRISLDLRVGQVLLTQGFVPAFLLGRRVNFDASIGGITWKFARPMLIGPGARLTPVVKISSGTSTVNFTMRGRALPSTYTLPSISHVPFLTWWEHSYSAAGNARSYAPALTNPMPSSPLHCQRFIGTDEDSSGSSVATVLDAQLFHSNGQGIAKDRTPFGHLFNFNDKSWNNPFKLLPRESIYAKLNYAAPAEATTVRIGLQGYRAVPIAEVL